MHNIPKHNPDSKLGRLTQSEKSQALQIATMSSERFAVGTRATILIAVRLHSGEKTASSEICWGNYCSDMLSRTPGLHLQCAQHGATSNHHRPTGMGKFRFCDMEHFDNHTFVLEDTYLPRGASRCAHESLPQYFYGPGVTKSLF